MRAAALLLLAMPATAGEFVPPEGCTTWLTVQARSCVVSNYYTCAADVPGDQWRADFDAEGPRFISRIDIETQWVESFDIRSMVVETLDPDPADPASFSELLNTGKDTYDFVQTDSEGVKRRFVGHDRLTGRTVVIDGIALQETEFAAESRGPDGSVISRHRGNEYIHAEWRRFFSGPSERDFGRGFEPDDNRPVYFIFPGEPGFGATEPVLGCDAVVSGLANGVIHVAD